MSDPSPPAGEAARRSSDRPLHLVEVRFGPERPETGEEPPGPEVLTRAVLPPPLGPAGRTVPGLPAEMEEAAFLFRLGETAVLLGSAAVRVLPPGEGEDDLVRRATEGAIRWREEQERLWKRVQVADNFVEFAQHLASAATEREVFRALVDCARRSVGGYAALVFAREYEDGAFHAVEDERLDLDLWKLSFQPQRRPLRAGVVLAEDTRVETGAPWSGLAPLFVEHGVASAAYLPVGREHVLFVLDRRPGRSLDPEDWSFLQVLAAQAEAVLTRLRLFEDLRSLSLTDTLTGLANRRQMRIVLDRTLAAARRGHPLTLVLLDIDHFKAINDRLGHLAGDRLLRQVADCLRAVVRGSDLVVRFGGDEFLIVLPDSDAAGGRALLRRLRSRLGPEVAVSAGIASYQSSTPSWDALIDQADRELLTAKQSRSAPSPVTDLPAPPAG